MLLKLPAKSIRADVIADYMMEAGYSGCVCFSCGNASAAMKERVDTLDVSPSGDLVPTRWWTPGEIRRAWPHLFDATSGHLPLHLMERIAHHLGLYIDERGGLDTNEAYDVPTGSGETIFCLRMQYPFVKFRAFQDGTPATEWSTQSPLYRFFA